MVAVFGLLGTLLLYPGLHAVDFGRVLRDPPFISGLGPIYASWATVPVLAFVCVAFLFLFLRNRLLRGDDPFHKVLWVGALDTPDYLSTSSVVCMQYQDASAAGICSHACHTRRHYL